MLIAVLLAVGLLAAACTSDGGDGASPSESTDDSTTTSSSSSTTSTTLDLLEDSEGTDLTGGEEPDLVALEELWGQLWDASGLVPEERGPAIALLGDAIHPIVAEGVPTMLIETTEREVHTYPVFELDSDGSTINIRDCIIYVPQIFESVTHIHSGTAIPDQSGGWIIDSVTRESRGCIPAELNDEILEDYGEFWEARNIYWNPPDPDHPGIEETMTGDHRDLIRERVALDLAAGLVVDQGQPERTPEITGVFTEDQIEITDCIVVDPRSGAFDSDGNREEGTEQRAEGARDLYVVTMRFENDRWKTDSVTVTIGSDCQQAPTPAGQPEV